jgi:hypothetical protein
MQIICGPTYPVASERGKTIHVPKEVGTVAVWRGEAVEVKYKNYVERLKAAAEAPKTVHFYDTSVAAPTLVPGWGIVKRGAPERYFIQQTTAGEVLLYEGVPAGCPASVAAQLVSLNNLTTDSPEAVEARRIAQCEKVNAELANKERDQSALARIFSGK